MKNGWLLRPLGPVPYSLAYDAMHDLAERRVGGRVPDSLVLLEHPPVYTAGRRSQPGHIRWTRERIVAAGAELHHVDRGGSLTFHGPGQLVGYPILDLGTRPDVITYLRNIEDVVIRAASRVGVSLNKDRLTGVWAGQRKVCAIGIKLIRARVTLHGFALNCSTDLSWFDAIVPCGLPDRSVTSMSELAGREVTPAEMEPLVVGAFAEVFGIAFTEAPDAAANPFAAASGAASTVA